MYLVLKFGGSSQCCQGMETFLERITEYLKCDPDLHIILVISAIQKTTNNLLDITNMKKDKYQEIFNVHQTLCKQIGVDFGCLEPLMSELLNDMLNYYCTPFIDILQQKIKIISDILSTRNITLSIYGLKTCLIVNLPYSF